MSNTYVTKLSAYICLLMLVFFVSACSEQNADAPDYDKVHPQIWTNPQFVNAESFHGSEVVTQGTESCAKCHDIEEKGQKNIPGCFGCHFGPDGSKVPEESDWTHGEEGHMEFEENQSVCNRCHEVERSFGTGPGICHNCHGPGETHVLGQAWLDNKSPQFHGDQSQQDCTDCHNLSTECNQCHFGPTGSKTPIGSGWLHGNNNEHEDYENQRAICNQCHTLNRSYDNGPARCHDCHDD